MTVPIQFDRQPYTVRYQKDGEIKTIRRVPPPKIHDAWPTDKVELNVKKNDDWQEGGVYTVKSIQKRQPNTLQIENDQGQSTFVSALDVSLKEAEALRPEEVAQTSYDRARSNEYLLWP